MITSRTGLLLFVIYSGLFINACLGTSCEGSSRGTCPTGQYCHSSESGCENTPLYQSCTPTLSYNCCPVIKCSLRCKYGFKPDGNNCSLCECLPNPCDMTECESPRTCSTRERIYAFKHPYEAFCGCNNANCAPCPGSVYAIENGCPTCKCLSICDTATCPPNHSCVPLDNGKYACQSELESCSSCDKKCEFGNYKSDDNCATCECQSDPCEGMQCLSPRECRAMKKEGKPHEAACECPNTFCEKTCPNGYVYENGCNTCECQSVCENVSCPPFHACVNKPWGSYACEPRYYVCQAKSCDTICPYGYKSDEKNCPSCECLPNPCDGVDCISPQTCQPRLRLGPKYPPYEARCECPTVQCSFCSNGYVYKNGCKTCECFDVCSAVTCPYKYSCVPRPWGRYACEPII